MNLHRYFLANMKHFSSLTSCTFCSLPARLWFLLPIEHVYLLQCTMGTSHTSFGFYLQDNYWVGCKLLMLYILLNLSPHSKKKHTTNKQCVPNSLISSSTVHASWWLHIPYGEYPSCLHTTLASLLSQKLSQMVPQVSLMHTSTLPWSGRVEPARRISPGVQYTT